MAERKRKNLLEKTARTFDLPGDVVAGLTRVELVGREELYLQNHRGILAYGEEEILISGGKLMLRVRGRALCLRSMTPTDLMISGQIDAVELE
ncbi:MAG: sporulation protein [Oscillospiraceae bacterium]|nr:sporulation protein [Oscillospiraceae bacterium]